MTESCEMYLKQILILKNKYGKVKSIDLAKNMNFSKASISKALSSLKEKEFIFINDSYIQLTEKGLKISQGVLNKYKVINTFLINTLNLNPNEAAINACKMEHIITDSCYREMINYIKEDIC